MANSKISRCARVFTALAASLVLSACQSSPSDDAAILAIMGIGMMNAGAAYTAAPAYHSVICHQTTIGMNCY